MRGREVFRSRKCADLPRAPRIHVAPERSTWAWSTRWATASSTPLRCAASAVATPFLHDGRAAIARRGLRPRAASPGARLSTPGDRRPRGVPEDTVIRNRLRQLIPSPAGGRGCPEGRCEPRRAGPSSGLTSTFFHFGEQVEAYAQVVDQGEREGPVGPPPLEDRGPLPVRPVLGWGPRSALGQGISPLPRRLPPTVNPPSAGEGQGGGRIAGSPRPPAEWRTKASHRAHPAALPFSNVAVTEPGCGV